MRRLNRIFAKDGKCVVVAMDHGMGLEVLPHMNDTGRVIEQVVEGGADAILTTFGIAKRYGNELGTTGLILRLDGGSSILGGKSTYPRLLYSVEEALKLGADAVVCMGFPGIEYEEESMENLARLAADCREWGVPLMAEMLPGGFGPEPPNTLENIKLASRIGCEYGADIIKTSFAGTPEEYRQVVEGSFSPVVILGGEKTKEISDLFVTIEDAMNVGVRGVAIGRNVCKHPRPDRMTAALVDLVHHGKTAREALEQLD